MRRSGIIFTSFLILTLLVGCVKEPIVQKEITTLNIYAVEYYSRAPVSNVQIVVKDDLKNIVVDKQYVDKEGKAIIENLKDGQSYTAYIYRVNNSEYVIQSTHTFQYDETIHNLFIETANPNSSSGIAVPLVMQKPELPNGCEITSLTAIFNYYGEEVNKLTMADKYLPKEPITVVNGQRVGPNPNDAFIGDPSELQDAFYVYGQPIVEAATSYLADVESTRQARDITGSSINDLKGYIDKGIPLLTWVTINWEAAETMPQAAWVVNGTNELHTPYKNLHAVVLLGLDEEYAYIMNPLTGYEYVHINTFTAAYETLERKAVVVY